MLHLYHYPSSVCVQKVRLALEELALDWSPIFVDIHAGEQFRPQYLRLNPGGVVPTLDHDGKIVIESNVILEYLADTFAEGEGIRPVDTFQRARMRLWLNLLDNGLHKACSVITGSANAADRAENIRRSGMSREEYLAAIPDAGRRETLRVILEQGAAAPQTLDAVKFYARTIDLMAETLSSSPFLAGDAYSLADIGLTPYLVRLDRLGMNDLIARHAAVADWYARMQARDNFPKAITAFDLPERMQTLRSGGLAAWAELKPKLQAARQ